MTAAGSVMPGRSGGSRTITSAETVLQITQLAVTMPAEGYGGGIT